MRTVLRFFMVLILFASCNKATITPNDPAPADSTSNDLLIKRVDIERQVDSIVTTYDYNADKKLVLQQSVAYTNSVGNPKIVSDARRFYRDATGRIIKEALKFSSQVDSVFYNFTYENHTSAKLLYKLGINIRSGKTIYDSTRYSYHNNGKVSKITYYSSGNWPAEPVKNNSFDSLDYNANRNLQYLQQFAYSPISLRYDPVIIYGFSYDTKTNPLGVGEDARLFDWFYSSKNNIVTQNVYIPITNEQYNNTLVYQYNSLNMPVSSTLTRGYANGGTVQTLFYYDK
jgi:hypothetical protein